MELNYYLMGSLIGVLAFTAIIAILGVKYNKRFLAIFTLVVFWGSIVFLFATAPYRWQRLKVGMKALIHWQTVEQTLKTEK